MAKRAEGKSVEEQHTAEGPEDNCIAVTME